MPCPMAAPSLGSGQNNPYNFSIRSPTQPRAPGKRVQSTGSSFTPSPGWGGFSVPAAPPSLCCTPALLLDPSLPGEAGGAAVGAEQHLRTRLGLVFPSFCRQGQAGKPPVP